MRHIQKFICYFLSVTLIICCFSFNKVISFADETTDNAAFSGEGTKESPYLISTKEDLHTLSSLINNPETAEEYYKKCYKQIKDIDLENEPFQPIGYWREDATKCSFYGLYQGNHHKITGLYVENTKGGAGLFSTLTGTVENLSVYGNIVADNVQGGGIASNTNNGKIVNCSFLGNISSKNNSYIGGIIGRIWRAGTIEGCYFNGTIDSDKAGGIVGVAYAGYEDIVQHINIKNCYSTGTIESDNDSVGGIIGHSTLNNTESTITYTNNYYLTTLASGGVCGKSVVGCTNMSADALKSCADMLGNPFVNNNWDNGFNDGYPIFEWQEKPVFFGEGTKESPYLISTKEDLHKLSSLINNSETAEKYYNKCYKQTNDIDLENELFKPIGDWRSDAQKSLFAGVYDGNYCKITNLYITNPERGAGLFRTLGGTVENLSVYGKISSNSVQIGGIAGNISGGGKIKKCSFSGEIVSENNEYCGGIVGQIWRAGTVEDCYFNGTIDSDKAGGIVGVAYAGYEEVVEHINIKNCYATGRIESDNNSIGGIVSHSSLSNSDSTITYTNNYYLSTLASGGVGGKSAVGCTKLVDVALKACADMLGNVFIDNNWDDDFNDGYPVFEWQAMPYKFEGEGTVENPYKIYNKNDLYAMKDMITNPYLKDQYNTKAYVQMSNIDLKNEKWEPEKFYFYGIYDGNCKSINNLCVDADYRDSGLFALVNGQNSMIKNLVVSGSVKGQNNVGGISGNIGYGTTIENCAFIGDVSGTKGAVGGISGYIWQGGNVINSYHTGSVTSESTSEVGGIIGYVDVGSDNGYNAEIENCYHAGKVSGSSEKTGGIAGLINIGTKYTVNVDIKNCYYLKNSATNSVASGTPSNDDTSTVTDNVLKLLAEDLGTPFAANLDESLNNGYPVFEWQIETSDKKVAGDANNDGTIDLKDVVMIRRYVAGGWDVEIDTANADVNADDTVDLKDVVLIRRYIAGGWDVEMN